MKLRRRQPLPDAYHQVNCRKAYPSVGVKQQRGLPNMSYREVRQEEHTVSWAIMIKIDFRKFTTSQIAARQSSALTATTSFLSGSSLDCEVELQLP
jgi:hypothetical protein